MTFQFDSIEWKVQHFYQSCKSLEYIEADREKPLMKIINNLGGETADLSTVVEYRGQMINVPPSSPTVQLVERD